MLPIPALPRRSWVLISLVLAGCARSDATRPAASALRAVRTAEVSDSTVQRPVAGTGSLAARDELPLSFKVGGVVQRVNVDDGQAVRAGQVLAVLDATEIDAAVTKADRAAEKAERDVARLERLFADSVATLAQVQDARTARDVAQADVAQARYNQRYARVVAPVDGVVLRRHVSPGELVAAGVPVVTLAGAARGTVLRVGLPDRDAVRVRRGSAARVWLDAYPGRELTGTVTEIAAQATPGTGTFAVEVSLPGARDLPTGLVGRVEIAATGAAAVTLVPVEALVEADGDSAAVYVLDGGRARRRAVQVAFLDGAFVGIGGGLAGARAVVVDGAAWLADGDSVRVVP